MIKDVQDLSIPATIQDVIMARVDSLPESAKEVLQSGSVIEREFSFELIKQVIDVSQEELLSRLSLLKDTELLYERGVYPQSNYIFKHALTREVVYDSLLTKRKKELHEKTGLAIEELYKDNIDEHYEVLAGHFIYAENYEKGAEYSRLSGRRAEKTGLLNDASVYGEKGVACLERLPRTEEVEKKLIHARTVLGLYSQQLSHFVKSKKDIEPIIDLASKSGYQRRISQIYTILGTYDLCIEENFPSAFKQLEKASKISEGIKDFATLVNIYYWLGCAHMWSCEFEEASHYWGKALDMSLAGNSPWAISTVRSSNWVYQYQGRIDLGLSMHETLQIAEKSGDIYSKAMAYNNFGVSCFYKGFFKELEGYLSKAIDLCERISLWMPNVYGLTYLGEFYFEIGEYQKSIDNYSKAILILEHTKMMPSWMNLSKLGVLKAKIMLNHRDIEIESLYGYDAGNKIKIYESQTRNFIAAILMNIDVLRIDEAESWIKKAIEAAKKNGMMWDLGRDYALYAELFKRKGDKPKAKENLNKAIEILKECGADGWVEKYEKELTALA